MAATEFTFLFFVVFSSTAANVTVKQNRIQLQ